MNLCLSRDNVDNQNNVSSDRWQPAYDIDMVTIRDEKSKIIVLKQSISYCNFVVGQLKTKEKNDGALMLFC